MDNTYYSNWYKQTVNSSGSNGISTSASTLLTTAQVTVCSVRDKLVYNMEYKQNSEETANKPLSRTSERRARESSVSPSSSNTFAAANVVAARFQNHSRNHSRRHSRKVSSESNSSFTSNSSNLSNLSDISTDSMWDDWILKYKTSTVDDAQIEDWIFDL